MLEIFFRVESQYRRFRWYCDISTTCVPWKVSHAQHYSMIKSEKIWQESALGIKECGCPGLPWLLPLLLPGHSTLNMCLSLWQFVEQSSGREGLNQEHYQQHRVNNMVSGSSKVTFFSYLLIKSIALAMTSEELWGRDCEFTQQTKRWVINQPAGHPTP